MMEGFKMTDGVLITADIRLRFAPSPKFGKAEIRMSTNTLGETANVGVSNKSPKL